MVELANLFSSKSINYNAFLHPDRTMNFIYALCLFFIGYFIAKRLSNITEHTLAKRFSRHQTMLAGRSVFYIVFILFCVTGLQHLGFKLSVLLGAAGVFTVAISFASQTVASNLISGIFLLFEHLFKVGDTVEVKGINGVVSSTRNHLQEKIKQYFDREGIETPLPQVTVQRI